MRVFKVIARGVSGDGRVGKIGLTMGKVRMTEDIPPQMDRLLRIGWWSIDGLARCARDFGYHLVFDGEKDGEKHEPV